MTLTGGLVTVTIQATQSGNGTYAAATPVNQSFTVALTPQTITLATIPGHSTTDAPFTLAPSASSGLTVSLAVISGPATISGNVVTLTATAGTVAIQATQAGNGTYAAATPVKQSFTVSLAIQAITFGAIPGHVANDPPFTLAPTASSGLAVSLAVTSGPATIVGDVVTFTGAAGTVTIQATQAGNGTYAAATPVSQSFTVSASQRGNIAYDQIRTADRTGNGDQLLTYTRRIRVHHPSRAAFAVEQPAQQSQVLVPRSAVRKCRRVSDQVRARDNGGMSVLEPACISVLGDIALDIEKLSLRPA